MKNSFRYSLMLIISITLCAFIVPSLNELTFNVTIKDLENKNVLKDGVAASELSQLTIKSSDATIEVKAFTIVLARGNAPINRMEVNGDSFELVDFVTEARAGDKILLEINRISSSSEKISKVLTILIH